MGVSIKSLGSLRGEAQRTTSGAAVVQEQRVILGLGSPNRNRAICGLPRMRYQSTLIKNLVVPNGRLVSPSALVDEGGYLSLLSDLLVQPAQRGDYHRILACGDVFGCEPHLLIDRILGVNQEILRGSN